MKRILAVAIIVALMLAMFTVFSVPHVHAQNTSQAALLSYSWYIAPSDTTSGIASGGDLIVVGEVQNVGSSIESQVAITATAYNSSQFSIGSNTFSAYGVNLLPGQKSPFYLDIPQSNSVTPLDPNWANSVTNVNAFVVVVTDTTQTPYSGLSIASGSKATDSSGIYTVSGTIVNNGSETVGNVWVLSTFYDSNGTVVGIGVSPYAANSLAPGDSTPFTVSPTDADATINNTTPMSGDIASYSLLVQYSPLAVATPTPPPSGSSPTPTPSTPANTATPAQSPTPIPSSTVIYVAIGVVVVVVIILVVLMLISKRGKTAKLQTPPPPPPPPPT